jgi:hypothetical protein|uniref:Uncharacterized protein n=1 Tax=Phaeodactylum tricornutum TaxID=2850 RepID=A0A8J9X703_PHATR
MPAKRTRSVLGLSVVLLALPIMTASFSTMPSKYSPGRGHVGDLRSSPIRVTGRPSSIRTDRRLRHAPSQAPASGSTWRLGMSSPVHDDSPAPSHRRDESRDDHDPTPAAGWIRWLDAVRRETSRARKLPPLQVEDLNLLFYDIFLILNLVVSISFWVVHRMQLEFIGLAFNEGCLVCLLWIAAGLYSGAFLDSAVDGHYGSADERGGPKAAGLLGFQTFVNTINLRLLFALVVALAEHRPVGAVGGEQLMPLEIGFGLILMSGWRALHSSFVPRFK